MTAIGHNNGPPLVRNSGWISIARSMRGHHLVGFHLFARPCDPERGALQPALAFIDLLMECQWQDGAVINGGRRMEIKRGQVIGAVSWLAARWNWTPMAVRIWLDKLEADEMISRIVPGASESQKHVGKVATVITICNYDHYQRVEDIQPEQQQTKEQTSNKQATNKKSNSLNELGEMRRTEIDAEQQTKQRHYKEEQKKQEYTPPTPPRSGGKRRGFTLDQIKFSDAAFDLYNRAADTLHFARCDVRSEDRRSRLLKRLEEIGGMQAFRRALWAVRHDEFLSGRTTAHSPNPFRLSLDVLLQTKGNMGDVLARLIELDAARPSQPASVVGESLAALSDDEQAQLVAQHANGIWPRDTLGFQPGDPRCAIRPHVYRAQGIDEQTYDKRGIRNKGAAK